MGKKIKELYFIKGYYNIEGTNVYKIVHETIIASSKKSAIKVCRGRDLYGKGLIVKQALTLKESDEKDNMIKQYYQSKQAVSSITRDII